MRSTPGWTTAARTGTAAAEADRRLVACSHILNKRVYCLGAPELKLTASDFQLVVDGKTYYVDSASLDLRGDPGDKYYTSVELTWTEHGREMRLFMYLHADDSTWWSEEIRTYDGQLSAEWIYYYGSFFNMPLGVPFVGDLTLKNNGPDDTVSGTITFRNMNLLPTFNPWIYSY